MEGETKRFYLHRKQWQSQQSRPPRAWSEYWPFQTCTCFWRKTQLLKSSITINTQTSDTQILKQCKNSWFMRRKWNPEDTLVIYEKKKKGLKGKILVKVWYQNSCQVLAWEALLRRGNGQKPNRAGKALWTLRKKQTPQTQQLRRPGTQTTMEEHWAQPWLMMRRRERDEETEVGRLKLLLCKMLWR